MLEDFTLMKRTFVVEKATNEKALRWKGQKPENEVERFATRIENNG